MANRGGIRIDDKRARRMLEQAGARSADLRPVWGDVNANVIQPAMQRRFQSGGAFMGAGWKRLAPSTVQRRLNTRGGNRGGVSRPLWDQGRLRGSWVKQGPESVFISRRLSMERGTDVPYARFHQEGQGVPQRQQVTDELVEHVGREAADRIGSFITEE